MRYEKRRRRKRPSQKKSPGVMNIVLIIVGVSLFAFTISMIQVFKEYGAVPDTLVTCVFAALGGECGIMGWIKTSKEKAAEAAKTNGSGPRAAPMDPPTEREEPPDVGL